MALFKTIQASLYLIVVWNRMVEEENQVQDEAVKAARQSVAVAMNQYKAGTVSYFNVLVVHVIALNNEKTAIDIQAGRWNASALRSAESLTGKDDKHPQLQRSETYQPDPAGTDVLAGRV